MNLTNELDKAMNFIKKGKYNDAKHMPKIVSYIFKNPNILRDLAIVKIQEKNFSRL